MTPERCVCGDHPVVIKLEDGTLKLYCVHCRIGATGRTLEEAALEWGMARYGGKRRRRRSPR